MSKKRLCVGIDSGNVFMDTAEMTPERFNERVFDGILPIEGVIAAAKVLYQKSGGEVFIAYNATDLADPAILAWYETVGLTERTGIPTSRLGRVYKRDKLPLCKLYGATHFVDDRLEVLRNLIGTVPNLILFKPRSDEIKEHSWDGWENEIVRVHSWEHALEVILSSS